MKRNKFLALCVVAVLIAATMAACGSQPSEDTSASDNTSASDDTPSSETETADSPEQINTGGEPTVYRLSDVEAVQLKDPAVAASVKKVSIEPIDTGGEPLKIGYSQMEVNNTWRIVMNDYMETAVKGAGWEYVYRDAQASIEKQNRDVEELIHEGCDFIVISPYEYEGLGPALKAAKEAGIPVILADREAAGVPGEDFVTAILGDFVDTGYKAGEALRAHFGDEHINVVEITGTAGSSVARDLSQGFKMWMEDDGNVDLVTSADGNFGRAESLTAMQNIIQAYGGEFNAVFTHVDDGSLAAIQALKEAGYTPGPDFANGEIAISSMCGYQEAFDAILAGEQTATMECTARFGPAVVDIINRLQEGGEIATRLVMPTMTYDISNAAEKYSDALAPS
jgi:ribose transport system substrate-binding protein